MKPPARPRRRPPRGARPGRRGERDEAPPRVGRGRRAFSVMGGPVETEGEADAAAALAELFDVEPALERALTHGFHSYAGRMHPSMARGALAAFSRAGQRVLDPFCGSGTVLVEAMAAGRAAVGLDASPLAVALANVRANPLSPAERARLIEAAQEVAEESADHARRRKPLDKPDWARAELARFEAHVLLELLGLRALILQRPDDAVGRALRLCLSSILVKFGRDPRDERGETPRRVGRGVSSSFFARRAEELARGLEALAAAVPPGTPPVRCAHGDARDLSRLRPGSFDLALTSPPYAGVYDYGAQHDVRFSWLDLPREPLDRSQIGARGGRGPSPDEYREDRARYLGELARVLRSGGRAVLIIGDGVLLDAPEDAAAETAAAARAAGLRPVARASQERPTFDARLRVIFGGRPRREHAVLLVRP